MVEIMIDNVLSEVYNNMSAETPLAADSINCQAL